MDLTLVCGHSKLYFAELPSDIAPMLNKEFTCGSVHGTILHSAVESYGTLSSSLNCTELKETLLFALFSITYAQFANKSQNE